MPLVYSCMLWQGTAVYKVELMSKRPFRTVRGGRLASRLYRYSGLALEAPIRSDGSGPRAPGGGGRGGCAGGAGAHRPASANACAQVEMSDLTHFREHSHADNQYTMVLCK